METGGKLHHNDPLYASLMNYYIIILYFIVIFPFCQGKNRVSFEKREEGGEMLWETGGDGEMVHDSGVKFAGMRAFWGV